MNARIRIDGADAVNFEQSSPDTILRAALRAGVGFPYECNSGGCGSCAFELVSGTLENLWEGAPGWSARDRRKGRYLACQCRAAGDVTIRVRTGAEYLPETPPQRVPARLVERRAITHDLHEFVFRSDGPAHFRPGQYASLHLPGLAAPRCYSMSNLPNDAGRWEFQIRRIPAGQATHLLFDQMAPGASIELDGPYGLAWLRSDSPRDIVCIAGGSGLAPMVSITRGAAAAHLLEQRKVHFFYGARTPADVCGADMLQALDPGGQAIRYVASVSAAEGTDWSGRRGFIHDWLARELPAPLSAYEFYFAGPPPMTQALQELLMVEHRVPFGQVHFDRFF